MSIYRIVSPPFRSQLPRRYANFKTACSSYHYRDWNDTFNTLCFDSYNTSSVAFHDYAVNNTINRQWFWMLCNEPFAYWQV